MLKFQKVFNFNNCRDSWSSTNVNPTTKRQDRLGRRHDRKATKPQGGRGKGYRTIIRRQKVVTSYDTTAVITHILWPDDSFCFRSQRLKEWTTGQNCDWTKGSQRHDRKVRDNKLSDNKGYFRPRPKTDMKDVTTKHQHTARQKWLDMSWMFQTTNFVSDDQYLISSNTGLLSTKKDNFGRPDEQW